MDISLEKKASVLLVVAFAEKVAEIKTINIRIIKPDFKMAFMCYLHSLLLSTFLHLCVNVRCCCIIQYSARCAYENIILIRDK